MGSIHFYTMKFLQNRQTTALEEFASSTINKGYIFLDERQKAKERVLCE